MNLQALLDLKERLEYIAIAGTGLIGEDFRLHRAIDGMEPLAKASPVFAKIHAGARALIAAPAEERGVRLLDVLSLVDAVVYTQGKTAVPGDLTPRIPGQGSYTRIPYGTLRPLMDALSGSGSGRTALIKEYWTTHPEYFRDFRVVPHLVDALKDNYAELAELSGEILAAQGRAVIPLLKAGFDPSGKTEMVRRVRLIGEIGGSAENEWFLSALTDAKKDVRVAIIGELGRSQQNTRLLLDLCRTEKGKAREAALRSLARMETHEALAFWESEARKKPDSISILAGLRSRIASALAAIAFRALVKRLLTEANQINRSEILRVLDTVSGNYSPALAEVWQLVSDHMDEIHTQIPGDAVQGYELSGAELLSQTMLETVFLNQTAELHGLVRELAAKNRKWFLCCAVASDLLRLTPEAHYEKYSSYVVPNENKQQECDRLQIWNGLGKVGWDEQKKRFCIHISTRNPENGGMTDFCQPLMGFDNRWLGLMTRADIGQHGQILYTRAHAQRQGLEFWLMQMICPDDRDNCRIIGVWLYRKLKRTGSLQPYATGLLACGWKEWKGVLAYCASHDSQVVYHQYIRFLSRMPISNREKAAELRELDALVSSGRVSVWYHHWPSERIQFMITRLENNEDVEFI